jgi:hypothetical protein
VKGRLRYGGTEHVMMLVASTWQARKKLLDLSLMSANVIKKTGNKD